MTALLHLQRANEVRSVGASLRREIGSRRHDDALRQIALVLLNPPPEIQRMRVGLLLRSLPYVGPCRLTELLEEAWIDSPDLVVGPDHGDRKPITERQRRRLVSVLLWRRAA